jgi:hypothetical protein
VTGTTLAIVLPTISTTSKGKFDMSTSSDQDLKGYLPMFKEP